MSKNWKQVPLPLDMLGMEKDRRGYPVPYNVLHDKDGVPHFAVNDSAKELHAIKNGICTVCGNAMSPENMWLVGGPLSAFHPQGAYMDAPMHKLCIEYSLQVCPYLANTSYTNLTDPDALDKSIFEGVERFENPSIENPRVPFHVMVRVSGIDLLLHDAQGRYTIRPHKPYLDVAYWKDGKPITVLEAHEMYLKQWAEDKTRD